MEKKKTNKKASVKTKIKKVKDIVLDKDTDDNSFTIIEVVIIVLISILFGVVVGYLINYSKNDTTKDANLSEIVSTYNNIVGTYYKRADKDKLSSAAIKGMVEALEDPYSNYMDTDDTVDFNESVDGSFVGIGVTIQQQEDEYNHIIDMFEDSPAAKAGLKVGDYFIKVDGKEVKGLSGTELSKLIKGKKGTKVVVVIKRGNKEKEITITRDVIELESVSSKMIDNIGYIRIDSFAANTYSQFYKQLNKLEDKKMKSLIIDVRSNPGGHLLQTKQILSLFFNSKTVLYQIESKNTKKKEYSYSNESRKYPVVVLIDSASASASEILASCFQDNYKKATIIGNTTYGKGTVQKTQTLSNGTTIKYTTDKWLTAKGKWLNEKGVKPDIEVNLTEEYANNPCDDTDTQLQEAIKVLKESK